MDYEKRYNEILGWIINIYPSFDETTKRDAEYYFPELAESERIRKGIISGMKALQEKGKYTCFANIPMDNVFAWLEKQGEHAKFRDSIQIGDKVTRNEDGVLINLSQLNRVTKKDEKQGEQKPQIKLVFPKFRVGDIIQHIPLEKWDTTKKITHIDETGYYFNLSHQGDTVSGGFIGFSLENDYELVEQMPTMIQWKGDNLKEVIGFTGKDKNFDKWFASFEEYERYVHEHNNIFKLFNEDGSHYEVPVGAWIVRTPDGYNIASKAVFKPASAEWSEEDEKILSDIIKDLVHPWNEYIPDRIEDEIKWLKNRLKSLRPQNHWKPSDEQIEILDMVLTNESMDDNIARILRELREQLKKLRG